MPDRTDDHAMRGTLIGGVAILMWASLAVLATAPTTTPCVAR